MKKSYYLLFLLLIVNLFSCQTNKEVNTKDLENKILKQVPGLTKIDSIKKTDIAQLYEVVIGRKILYVTGDAKYIILGNIVELENKNNITEKRTEELNIVDISKIPLELAVKVVNDDGKGKIFVFTDPNCPYCQMFEQKIVSKLKNVTIYNFLLALPSHPQSALDIKKIWCASNQAAVWTAWMERKVTLPKDTSCDTTALEKVKDLANNDINIEGTPTVIFENGHIMQGMMAPEDLNKQIEEIHDQVSNNSTDHHEQVSPTNPTVK